jgi:PAS domain S-box-containing protein
VSSFNESDETPKPRNPFTVLTPYVAVCAALAVVSGLIFAVHEMSWPIPVSLLLLIPIFVGAFWGGLSAGVFAMILGLAADYFLFGKFLPGGQRLFPYVDEQVRLASFIVEGLLLNAVGHWHRLSRFKAQEAGRRQRMLEQEIVRRRKLEESLVRSQRAVKSQLTEIEGIYATAPVGLCFVDRDLRFVRVNQELAEIHGIPVEEHIGKSVQEVVPEIGLALVPLLRRVIVSGEAILDKEIGDITLTGALTKPVLLVNLFPIKEIDGFVSGVNVAVREISGQKRFEETLRESEEKYRLLAEVSPLAIWTAAPDGSLLYASHHWLEYSGLTLEQSLGQGWASVLHPEDRERVFAEQAEILEKSCPYETELRFRCHRTGEYRWHLVRALPLRDDGGRVRQWMGIAMDIHQMKCGEAAWKDSHARLLLALEVGRMAVWERDFSTGAITWLDPTNIHSAVGFEDHFLAWVKEVAERSEPSVSDGDAQPLESYSQEFQIVLPDGQLNWVEARGQQVLGGGRLVGVVSDVTDRKRAEDGLRHVKEVEEALREADRRKDEFIALLAHELRNPLAPILTSAQLLKRRGSERPELIESATESIERQVKYLTRLINDLLDISRVARGKLKLSFEVTDMAAVIAHAVEVCRPAIEKNQQELVHTGTGQPLYLWGDPARLSQIIANLLMNAAKFTPSNGRIELAMERKGPELRIQVRDNGIGIEPDALEHIFEPFVQYDRPLHNGHSGLGLGVGLALVKSLVEMHGGRISVASPGKDQGTEFSIRLPLFDHSNGRKSNSGDAEDEVQPIRSPVSQDEAHTPVF